MRQILILMAALSVAAAACMVTRGSSDSRLAGYRSWRLITPKALEMDPVLASLCAPTPLIRGTGHGGHFFRVFVNNKAAEQALKSRNRLPVGSEIVKEKLDANQKVELLTVMLKHSPGYNPKSGDWEFLVADAKGRPMPAPADIANCLSCHESFRAHDYVFGTYVDGGKLGH